MSMIEINSKMCIVPCFVQHVKSPLMKRTMCFSCSKFECHGCFCADQVYIVDTVYMTNGVPFPGLTHHDIACRYCTDYMYLTYKKKHTQGYSDVPSSTCARRCSRTHSPHRQLWFICDRKTSTNQECSQPPKQLWYKEHWTFVWMECTNPHTHPHRMGLIGNWHRRLIKCSLRFKSTHHPTQMLSLNCSWPITISSRLHHTIFCQDTNWRPLSLLCLHCQTELVTKEWRG
jgi:hypothetical protein